MSKEKIFNISSIHQQYWKEFCDVCYSRFGFEDGEERTYEQKYETFCRCKFYVTEDKNYEQSLIKTKEEDIARFRKQVELFYDLRDAGDMIPSLYALVTMMNTVVGNIKSDMELVRYICPRKPLMNYEDMHIRTPKEWREDIVNDINIDNLNDPLQRQMLAAIDLPPYVNGYKISVGTRKCARRNLTLYETAILDLESVLPTDNECPKGSELQAFLYRLFMSYEDSLTEVKEQLDELPSPMNLEELKEDSERLVKEFYSTPLGERWAKCIVCEGGLKHFANYFMHHRKDFTEEDEHRFFYTLDKVCIIEDVLNGKADKYWLEVKYPDGWLENREDEQTSLSSQDQALLNNDNSNRHSSFALTNLIFNPRLFDSTARLERLRRVIACAISVGSNHTEDEDKNEYTLNLQQKSEWYYLMQAFVEAEVTRSVPTAADLYKQMKAWFPEVAVLEGDGTEDELTRKLTGSISAEKTKWKEMGTDKSVPLKEMVIKNQASERMKPERCRDLYKAAYAGLCVKLKELKEEITSTRDGRR